MLEPGMSVARVARAHGGNANQVFAWRRLYRQGLLEGANGKTAGLLAVRAVETLTVKEAVRAKSASNQRAPQGMMELEFPKGNLRIAGRVDQDALRVVLEKSSSEKSKRHKSPVPREDTSGMLEYVPEDFNVLRQVRTKLVCACCDKIVQAEAPSRPIARDLARARLLAHVRVAKHACQSEMYARAGVELERSTLADRVGSTALL